jgi:hypothetical protein
MTDAIDLQAARMVQSPHVAAWTPTLRIVRVSCTAAGGFVVAFDRPVPAAWKWPSNPAVPSDNLQWTWWVVKQIGGVWYAAGLVQMWQDRPMGTRALPPLFADVDGAPGWTRLWGEGDKWPGMHDPPRPGEALGLLVSAGNGRLTTGITSVAERSNVVLWTVPGNDEGDQRYLDAPPIVVDPPVVDPPIVPPVTSAVEARLAAIEAQLTIFHGTIAALTDALVAVRAPTYTGTLDLPQWLSNGKIVLTPQATP